MTSSHLPLLTLVVHVPDGSDRRFELTQWRTVIGRSSKSDLKIISKQISKIHAVIEINDGIPFVRDLGSRNGVEVNGQPIARAWKLSPGDKIVLGDVEITIDPQSLVFRPRDSQTALQSLLEEEAELRSRSLSGLQATVDSNSNTTPERDPEATREAVVLVGLPLGNASGHAPVVRTLRLADALGPRDVARVEPFVLELERGEQVWVKPRGDVELVDLDSFPVASNVWFDEPEDFAEPGMGPVIIARETFYLPPQLKVVGAHEMGRTPEGRRIFSEAKSAEPLVVSPTD